VFAYEGMSNSTQASPIDHPNKNVSTSMNLVPTKSSAVRRVDRLAHPEASACERAPERAAFARFGQEAGRVGSDKKRAEPRRGGTAQFTSSADHRR